MKKRAMIIMTEALTRSFCLFVLIFRKLESKDVSKRLIRYSLMSDLQLDKNT